MNLLLAVFCLIFLLGFSGCLSASETSFFSLSPLTLRTYRHSVDQRQRKIAAMMSHPRDVLVTILILNIFSNLLIQNIVSSIFEPFASWFLKVGLPLALVLVLGEIIPKSIALPNNVQIAAATAPVIEKLMRGLHPVISRLNACAGWISRLFFFFLREEQAADSGELRHLVRTSTASSILIPQESDLIEGALDLKEATVKELMRPRDEMLFYDIQEPITQLNDLLIYKRCSRVPVCDGQIDRLVGILSMQSFFRNQGKIHNGSDLAAIVTKPRFVPESMNGWSLLCDLRESGEQMAIVVDEYGVVSGLVTQEDLIETIVGEISDQRDEKALYTRFGSEVIIASGKMEVSQFEDLFATHLPSRDGPVTLGGWLIEQLGDIPAAGTKYSMDGFLFYVLAADPNRIRRIYVRRIHPPKRPGGRP
jgi:putative hemolysin